MSSWQGLFALKCEDHNSFLSFYSKSKATLHKLKWSNSIAVTDKVFLKAFFAKVIFVEKLQSKTKKLLKDGNETCAEILENIRSDYRSLETGELMREVTDPSSNFLSSRQLPKEDFSKKITNVAHAMNALPHNVNNLLPRIYYSRFRE